MQKYSSNFTKQNVFFKTKSTKVTALPKGPNNQATHLPIFTLHPCFLESHTKTNVMVNIVFLTSFIKNNNWYVALRLRDCDDPLPMFGGDDCDGDHMSRPGCNDMRCPVMFK